MARTLVMPGATEAIHVAPISTPTNPTQGESPLRLPLRWKSCPRPSRRNAQTLSKFCLLTFLIEAMGRGRIIVVDQICRTASIRLAGATAVMNSSPTSWETGPADQHFHSRFSDGVFWPSELVARLATDGITMAALTDHDTFAGVPEFLGLAREAGVTGVAAVEIDFTDPTFGFQSELLAYFSGGQYARTDARLSADCQAYVGRLRAAREAGLGVSNCTHTSPRPIPSPSIPSSEKWPPRRAPASPPVQTSTRTTSLIPASGA